MPGRRQADRGDRQRPSRRGLCQRQRRRGPGTTCMIAVSDTGTGIPAGDPRQGVRAVLHHQGRRARAPGSAFRMVYGFVKQSRGHIKIYSEEGHGTTIKIYLPRAGSDRAEAAAERDAGGDRGRHTRPSWWSRTTGWCATTCWPSCIGSATSRLPAANAAEALAHRRQRQAVRPAVHRRDHARHDERHGSSPTRCCKTRPDPQGAVHVRLHRERDHPSRPARSGRAAAGEAVSQVRSGADHPQGAER